MTGKGSYKLQAASYKARAGFGGTAMPCPRCDAVWCSRGRNASYGYTGFRVAAWGL